MRVAVLAASLLFLAGGVTSCGDDGDDGSGTVEVGTGASVEDFCGTYQDLADSLGGADPADLAADEDARKDYIEKLKAAVDELSEVGTPDDIPQSARDGFESSIAQIKGLPDNPSQQDLDDITDVSAADAKDQAAFGRYLTKTCPTITR